MRSLSPREACSSSGKSWRAVQPVSRRRQADRSYQKPGSPDHGEFFRFASRGLRGSTAQPAIESSSPSWTERAPDQFSGLLLELSLSHPKRELRERRSPSIGGL